MGWRGREWETFSCHCWKSSCCGFGETNSPVLCLGPEVGERRRGSAAWGGGCTLSAFGLARDRWLSMVHWERNSKILISKLAALYQAPRAQPHAHVMNSSISRYPDFPRQLVRPHRHLIQCSVTMNGNYIVFFYI